MYGEASETKIYNGPFLLYTLIELPNQNFPTGEMGVDFDWRPTFRFLRDDLLTGSLGYSNLTEDIVPQIGDIIFYQEGYYEITSAREDQYYVGKNPDYPNDPNPLETDLNEFGYNVSIICDTIYVPADKVGLSKERT
jgi:hypothetical protein